MKQKQVFDVITLVWQQMKPYLAMIPLSDSQWLEVVDKTSELENYIQSRYGENSSHLAAKMMVGIIDYMEKESKEG